MESALGRHVVGHRELRSRFPTLYVCALPLTFPIHAFVMMSHHCYIATLK